MRAFRLPFFYGWMIVATAFVTMGLGVNARTAFSLFLPPILDEFDRPRSLTAGAFSFGFLVSAAMSPFLGRLVDHYGPRLVIEMGVGLLAAGLMLAPLVRDPWHLYATLGVLVGAGGNCLGYTGHALFLPNWFVRRRGLAMSLAFSGVGIGSIILMPWLQPVRLRPGPPRPFSRSRIFVVTRSRCLFGEDHAVFEFRVTGTPRGGAPFDLHACDILTLRGGMIAAKRAYRKARP